MDKGVLHRCALAKYAVAFSSMSRSIFSRAFSARKRLISICSALTWMAWETVYQSDQGCISWQSERAQDDDTFNGFLQGPVAAR